ncbi:hypothetical protein BJ322DRAFT_19409 [Thelephora terrestris]|uniref:Uncharacterized protein n=1 Tax=Thelephora terrestris TaxID=56493 RepID=A0A9P6HSX8_9AGAM|nr:hypothetical protein BJ322DRAFT_19409 [Thelephora terrestris]
MEDSHLVAPWFQGEPSLGFRELVLVRRPQNSLEAVIIGSEPSLPDFLLTLSSTASGMVFSLIVISHHHRRSYIKRIASACKRGVSTRPGRVNAAVQIQAFWASLELRVAPRPDEPIYLYSTAYVRPYLHRGYHSVELRGAVFIETTNRGPRAELYRVPPSDPAEILA